ncbi:MAG: CDP-glycerol glycerophosphotransferase family protein [Methanobacteriota archaeon]|nr:MAG: CDP-glycerol glycerophosphotransferase family protein [Euryarchaeota archaeon]
MIGRVLEQRSILIVLCLVFRALDYFWPKDRDCIVFLGRRNMGYSDNSRYLFEKFLSLHNDEIHVLWVTPEEDLLHDDSIGKDRRDHMVYLYSVRGIVSLLRARAVLLSWMPSGFPGADFSSRTVVIQLWHGIPIKRISLCQKGLSERQMALAARELRKIDYWICSSRLERDSLALCTGLPVDNLKITGYPRNDYLIENRDSGDARLLTRFPFIGKKVILYAPTWRSNDKVKFFPFDDFSKDKLTSFLEANDAYLLLRAHYGDDILALKGAVDYDAFEGGRVLVMNRDSIGDVQDILPFVDVLISDYSGVWLDYLLLDRPIIFVPYDLAMYESTQGLLYDYDSITPGPKVRRFIELLSELEGYFADPHKGSIERNRTKCMFHEHDDGLAHKRIYELIKEATSEAE